MNKITIQIIIIVDVITIIINVIRIFRLLFLRKNETRNKKKIKLNFREISQKKSSIFFFFFLSSITIFSRFHFSFLFFSFLGKICQSNRYLNSFFFSFFRFFSINLRKSIQFVFENKIDSLSPKGFISQNAITTTTDTIDIITTIDIYPNLNKFN